MILLEVYLPDIPGSLIELIKPISENGGNIYGILHHHDKKIDNMIPVEISFELNQDKLDSSIEQIKKSLIQQHIEIIKISIDSKHKMFAFILSGHVFDTDITDTINYLHSKDIRVLELQAIFSGFEEISNVKLRVEFPDYMSKPELIDAITNICRKKSLFFIKS
jgi:ACT domain-containing protein